MGDRCRHRLIVAGVFAFRCSLPDHHEGQHVADDHDMPQPVMWESPSLSNDHLVAVVDEFTSMLLDHDRAKHVLKRKKEELELRKREERELRSLGLERSRKFASESLRKQRDETIKRNNQARQDEVSRSNDAYGNRRAVNAAIRKISVYKSAIPSIEEIVEKWKQQAEERKSRPEFMFRSASVGREVRSLTVPWMDEFNDDHVRRSVFGKHGMNRSEKRPTGWL